MYEISLFQSFESPCNCRTFASDFSTDLGVEYVAHELLDSTIIHGEAILANKEPF